MMLSSARISHLQYMRKREVLPARAGGVRRSEVVAVPAWVWRFPLIVRALIIGPALGLVIGALALIGPIRS